MCKELMPVVLASFSGNQRRKVWWGDCIPSAVYEVGQEAALAAVAPRPSEMIKRTFAQFCDVRISAVLNGSDLEGSARISELVWLSSIVLVCARGCSAGICQCFDEGLVPSPSSSWSVLRLSPGLGLAALVQRRARPMS